jgi:hypothetical protein
MAVDRLRAHALMMHPPDHLVFKRRQVSNKIRAPTGPFSCGRQLFALHHVRPMPSLMADPLHGDWHDGRESTERLMRPLAGDSGCVPVLALGEPLALRHNRVFRVPRAGHARFEDTEPGQQ